MSNVVQEVITQLLQKSYAVRIHRAGKTQDWTTKRKRNIFWIRDLTTTNSEGLQFGIKERLLRLATTRANESIYIQYPGKESVPNRKYPRPWDFRPKLKLANGEFAKDLSFYDIWDTIYQNMCAKDIPDHFGAVLGLMFYRMAYMCDHVQRQDKAAPCTDLDILSGSYEEQEPANLDLHWDYTPPSALIQALGTPQLWAGMSLEGFLLYNELLALNEDCKYYYRDVEERKEPWKASGVGRVNNLLTHLSVIGFHESKLTLATLLSRFSQSQGVAAAQKEEAISICHPFIS